MQPGSSEPPLNPLPWVVWALCLPMIAMELVLQAGAAGLVGGPTAIGWRLTAYEELTFSTAMYREALTMGLWWDEVAKRLATYPLVHNNFINMAFSVALTMALGKWVAEVIRPIFVLLVFFAASVVAALIYGILPLGNQLLAGASPGVYGLIGAFTFALWARLIVRNGPQQSAFLLVGFLLGMQIVFAVGFGWYWAWLADLLGFLIGFALTALLVPGGWDHMLSRLRRR